MTREPFRALDDFPPTTPETWRAKVLEDLKGADFDRALAYRSAGGFTAEPLYHALDFGKGDPSGFPGTAPFTRGFWVPTVGADAGSEARAGAREPWRPAVIVAFSDPAEANRRCHHDLSLGARRIYLQLGLGGVEVGSLGDFDRLLKGVEPTFIELVLEAEKPLAVAGLLAEWARSRAVDLSALRGAVVADPLGRLARSGTVSEGLERAWKDAFEVFRWSRAQAPGLRCLRVDTTAYHEAGASPVQELACGLASGVEILRRGTAAGFETRDLARQIEAQWAVSCDQFLEIAKIRAWRKVWAKVLAATGAEDAIADQSINLVPSSRVSSRVDPWVNLLRSTTQVFVGAIAGVDSIVAGRWDEISGADQDASRRVAINSHHVLAEESYLSQVSDPAGGSWAIEALTEKLAEASWSQFQSLEKAGGMPAVLLSGEIQRRIGETSAERRRDLARRKDVKVGVSMYANLTETRPEENSKAPAKENPIELDSPPPGHGFSTVEEAAKAWGDGLSLAAISRTADPSLPTVCEAMAPFREAEVFEALRLVVDAAAHADGHRAQICLAQLGSPSEARARAQFAADFFAVAGFASQATEPTEDPAELAERFRAAGAEVVVLCSSDERYQQLAASAAHALKAAGARRVYLAGQGGDLAAEWRRAGIDDFIFLKCDAPVILEALVRDLYPQALPVGEILGVDVQGGQS